LIKVHKVKMLMHQYIILKIYL